LKITGLEHVFQNIFPDHDLFQVVLPKSVRVAKRLRNAAALCDVMQDLGTLTGRPVVARVVPAPDARQLF